MTNVDSQRIKEIRDNTRAMAEAFGRIVNTLADALELYVSTQTETQNSNLTFEKADTPQTDSEVTRNSLRTDCTGCKFVGLYDTEFPCANCTRKNKDYYTVEQTDCAWK